MSGTASAPRTPLAAGFVGAGRRLATSDLVVAAARSGVPLAALCAVLDVESSGSGFDAQGRPKILFEPHIFHRELLGEPGQLAAAERAGLAYANQGEQPYPPTSEGNYQRLKRACLIDASAAMRSCSWGIAQVMGFNYAVGGYGNVEAMVQAVMDSEAAGFDLLLGFATKNGLIAPLRLLNFAGFARGYNGSGAVAAYAAKLQAAYLRHLAVGPARPAPVPVLVKAPLPGSTTLTLARIPPMVSPTRSVLEAPTSDSLNDAEWLTIRGGADPVTAVA